MTTPSSRRKPVVSRQSERTDAAQSLRRDSRALCPTCRGRGTYLLWPSEAHPCRMCGGAGVVCPTCRGMRFLRERAPGGAGNIAVPCGACGPGSTAPATPANPV